MRVAVLGAGAMGSLHAAAYASMEDVELAGIVGRRLAPVEALAARLGVPAFTDPRAILHDDSVDAIDITLPTFLHREFAVAALERGKHVLCETPLAANLADADAMIEAAQKHGRLLQVALVMRVAEPGVTLRKELRAGAHGRPIAFTSERLWPGAGIPPDHHGDALEELALFDFDYLIWSFGYPRSVLATAARRSGERVGHVLTILDFGGLQAFVEASDCLPQSFEFRTATRIVCERGTLEWHLRFPREGRPIVTVVRYLAEGEPVTLEASEADPYVTECRHFIQVMRQQADAALLSAEAAREGLSIVAAARESLARGGRVDLD